MLSFSLARLAEFLGCELAGDAGVLITGVSTIEKAGPGELTFLANLKYAPKIKGSRASAIIAAEPLKDSAAATLVSVNPYLDFARVLALFYQPPKPALGIHPTASDRGHSSYRTESFHWPVCCRWRARHSRG